MKERIKPGQDIYLIGWQQTSITKVKVEFVNRKGFTHSYSFNACYIDEFRKPCYYYEEDSRWFRKLSDAKAFLKRLHPNCRIPKLEPDYWEVLGK